MSWLVYCAVIVQLNQNVQYRSEHTLLDNLGPSFNNFKRIYLLCPQYQQIDDDIVKSYFSEHYSYQACTLSLNNVKIYNIHTYIYLSRFRRQDQFKSRIW